MQSMLGTNARFLKPPRANCRTVDNRFCTVSVTKAEYGQFWTRLFRGDSDGLRCLEPPYRLTGAPRSRHGGMGRRWWRAAPPFWGLEVRLPATPVGSFPHEEGSTPSPPQTDARWPG